MVRRRPVDVRHNQVLSATCLPCGCMIRRLAEVEGHEHDDIAMIKCGHCSYQVTFRRRLELATHYRNVHTEERPFQCAHCPRLFAWQRILNKHVKNVHGGNGNNNNINRQVPMPPQHLPQPAEQQNQQQQQRMGSRTSLDHLRKALAAVEEGVKQAKFPTPAPVLDGPFIGQRQQRTHHHQQKVIPPPSQPSSSSFYGHQHLIGAKSIVDMSPKEWSLLGMQHHQSTSAASAGLQQNPAPVNQQQAMPMCSTRLQQQPQQQPQHINSAAGGNLTALWTPSTSSNGYYSDLIGRYVNYSELSFMNPPVQQQLQQNNLGTTTNNNNNVGIGGDGMTTTPMTMMNDRTRALKSPSQLSVSTTVDTGCSTPAGQQQRQLKLEECIPVGIVNTSARRLANYAEKLVLATMSKGNQAIIQMQGTAGRERIERISVKFVCQNCDNSKGRPKCAKLQNTIWCLLCCEHPECKVLAYQ